VNFLGHAWLSGTNQEVLVANIAGDFYKGKVDESHPPAFRAGLILHRYIDDLTDNLPQLSEARSILKPYYKRYAGVALDVWLDHILARNFTEYHSKSLNHFTAEVYLALDSHGHLLVPEAQMMTQYLQKGDWLGGYATYGYMIDVMTRMSKRFNAPDLNPVEHPNEAELEKIELIFNGLSEELVLKTSQKLNEILRI